MKNDERWEVCRCVKVVCIDFVSVTTVFFSPPLERSLHLLLSGRGQQGRGGVWMLNERTLTAHDEVWDRKSLFNGRPLKISCAEKTAPMVPKFSLMQLVH